MQISVKTNVKEFERQVGRFFKDQIPYATLKAVNATANNVRKAYRIQAVKKLDRPTNATINGMYIQYAKNKLNVVATLGLKDYVEKYLDKQISGGTGGSTAVPVNVRLNAYGNIPGRRGGAVRKMSGRKNTFTSKRGSKLPPGIYQKAGGKRNPKLKMLVAFERSVKYRKRLPYFRMIRGVVRNTFDKEMKKAMDYAIKTAR